nr:hypothetical protein [Chthoniobacterales bacterium]
RKKFLRYFPHGFGDQTYIDWERSYKWETHERWEEALNRDEFRGLLTTRQYAEVAARAVRTEQRSRHSMIFSFEKMALRDAVSLWQAQRRLPRGFTNFSTAVAICRRASSGGVRWSPRFRAGRRAC